MKRRSSCECLPSPEYIEPEYLQFKSKLQRQIVTNEFLKTVGNELFPILEPNEEVQYKKLRIQENKPIIVIFFGIMNSYLSNINDKYELIKEVFNDITILGVSQNVKTNNYKFPIINSFNIPKKYNVLDPIGGGIYPRDVILIFDSNGVEKYQIPIIYCGRYLHNKPISDVLMDGLEEISNL